MNPTLPLLSALLFILSAFSHGGEVARDSHVLVEAEGFANRGGWVVDPQFMDLMGSPYLLAHGLGRPVADATTEVAFPSAGAYRVWVRTKDWVGEWQAPGSPGRFQVLVNGRTLAATFGTVGARWHWQDGGSVDMPAGKASLALHDLTGFEGRCDAILFTRDPGFAPPNADPAMAEFRRKQLGQPELPEPAGEFDFVVTGGGIAGTCAALSAARLGLKVALVQDRPVLGGNNSSEVRVWLQGARNDEPWPRIGDVVAELEQDQRAHYGPSNTKELYEDGKKLAVVRAERNITLLLEHRVNAVEVLDGRILAVIAQSTTSGRRLRIGGRFFADCTGDATVGALAGADFEMKPEGRMGPCNLWNVCECKDTNAINTGTDVSPDIAPFPRCPWALDLSDKPFPGRSKVKPEPDKLGGWYWESGFDRDPIEDMEAIRDWNFRAMYGAWDALKNVDKVLPNHTLNWSAYILGKRESRRLMGDVVLNFEDLKNDRRFPDGCAPTGWNNDLHRPDPRYAPSFEGDAFIAVADHIPFPASVANRPFWIPYRCLYSRNISNLFMAGRNISVTHDALGAVRVMRTCGTMGEIIGMAASLCVKHDTPPRAIHERHFGELQDLMRQGTGKVDGRTIPYENGGRKTARTAIKPAPPPWLKDAGTNLARSARVITPGAPQGEVRIELLLNDGNGLVQDNSARWISKAALPHPIEFIWNKPVRLGAARIISGYNRGGIVDSPIRNFTFQWHDGTAWRDIPDASVTANRHPDWSATFTPVETTRLRLITTATPGGVSRIWEVELYAPLAALQAGDAPKPAARPNILWIVMDDVGAELPCYGEKTIQTPNIDRLVREGTRFERAFLTASVCSPSRSAMITGMYQTTIGAHHHRSGRGTEKIHLPAAVEPVPAIFQRAGYHTSNGNYPATGKRVGKTDYNFEWNPKMYDGFDWAERMPGQPFFAQIQLWGGKNRNDNGRWYREVAPKALGALTRPEDVSLPPYYPRDPLLLDDWAQYLDCIRFCDQQVGEILKRLETEGILDQTLIILMGDNGISHARGKQFLYDEGIRTPFILRGPGVARGAVRTDLIEHIDMAATSLAGAGLPVPSWMQGRNILAKDYQHRAAVFAARDRCGETVDRIRSVRMEQFKYIRNFYPQRPLLQPNDYKDTKPFMPRLRELHAQGKLSGVQEKILFSPTRPAEELYDVQADPFEIRNLADDPQFRTTLETLRARLDRWMLETHDSGPESEKAYDANLAYELKATAAKARKEALLKNSALMKQEDKGGK